MAVQIIVKGIRKAVRDLNRLERNLAREAERINWRINTRATRDVKRLFNRILKEEIRKSTTRRTGALLRSRIIARRRRATGYIIYSPSFPATAYNTPPGRGKRGTSKRGQYAFIVNHQKRFIQKAVKRVRQSNELNDIIRKHTEFILQQVRRGL